MDDQRKAELYRLAVEALSRGMSRMSLYPVEHPLVADALHECAAALNSLHEEDPSAAFGLADGKLIGGRDLAISVGAHQRVIAEAFTRLDLQSITFRRGVSADELRALLQGLAAARDLQRQKKSLASYLSEKSVHSIDVNLTSYGRLGEGQGGGSGGAGGGGAGDGNGGGGPGDGTGGGGVGGWIRELSVRTLDEALIEAAHHTLQDPEERNVLVETLLSLHQRETQERVEEATRVISREKTAAVNDRERTSAVIGSMADGIVMVDEKGHLIMMNEAAEHLFGVHFEQVAGKPLSEISKDEQMMVLSQELDTPEDREIGRETVVKGADDTVKILRASRTLVQRKDGRPVGLVSITTDTARQRKFDELQQEFVLQMTHDLKAPLTSVKAALSMAMHDELGPITADQRRFLGLAQGNVERMAAMINELLDFARVEAGLFKVFPEPMNLAPVVEKAVDSLATWAANAKIDLTIEKDPRLPPVMGDARRIQQVLINLLSNALKYTPKGGRIVCRMRWERSAAGVPMRSVKVEVEDSGEGIPLEKQAHLFEKFEQLERGGGLIKSKEGTGLGLYIAKQIVTRHKGQIGARSVPGKGSLFWFTLPLSKMAIEPMTASPSPTGFWRRVRTFFKGSPRSAT